MFCKVPICINIFQLSLLLTELFQTHVTQLSHGVLFACEDITVLKRIMISGNNNTLCLFGQDNVAKHCNMAAAKWHAVVIEINIKLISHILCFNIEHIKHCIHSRICI